MFDLISHFAEWLTSGKVPAKLVSGKDEYG